MRAFQTKLDPFENEVVDLHGETITVETRLAYISHRMEGRALIDRFGFQRSQNIRRLTAGTNWRVFLDYASLFPRDLADMATEKFLMVDVDRCDHAGGRMIDYIGGIEPATKPDFNQCQVSRILGESQIGNAGHAFKEG